MLAGVWWKRSISWRNSSGFGVRNRRSCASSSQVPASSSGAAPTARVADLGLPTTILAEPIDGSRRVASWNLLDLRLQKSFKLGGGADFRLFADVLNTFNDDAYENVESSLGTAENFGTPSRFVFPRRLMLGAKFRF